MNGAGIRVALFIGQPVGKARTPAAFDAWAGATGTAARMLPLSVDPGALAATLTALRGWDNALGAVITFPHKAAAMAHLDAACDVARFTGACNVIRREKDGRLVGAMTDGIGCIGAAAAGGARLAGADMVLVGAGGAGSAIAHEAARRGVAQLVISDLDTARAAGLRTRLGAAFPALALPEDTPADFAHDILCNATPLGMSGEAAHPWPLDRCHADSLVIDVVPTPAMTPWLTAAAARGLRVQTGPEMVAAQFGHVTGHLMGVAPEALPVAG